MLILKKTCLLQQIGFSGGLHYKKENNHQISGK